LPATSSVTASLVWLSALNFIVAHQLIAVAVARWGHPNLLKIVHQPCCVGIAFLICIMQAFGKYLIDDLVFAFEEFSQDLAETGRRNTIICDDGFCSLELRSPQRKAGYISGLQRRRN
jgi:hypothetical protein